MYKAIIVDDEKMIRTGIKKIIPWASMGIDCVLTAASGEEALGIVEKEKPQIMLTDICMVEMNGITLIEQIRKFNPNMKIIVLTGYDDFSYAQQCCKLNVQDFILKPAEEEELINSVKKQVHDLDQETSKVQKQQLMSRVQGIAEQIELENNMRSFLDKDISSEYLKGFCDKHHFNPDQALQIAIIIPTENSEERRSEYHDFLHLSIKNICFELFDSHLQGITFEDKGGKITIAVFDSSEFDETIERVETLKTLLKNELDVQENVVLGSTVKGFLQMRKSYADALDLIGALQKRQGETLQTEESEQRLKTVYQKYYEQKKIMTENIADIDKLTEEFEKFCKLMEKYKLSNSLVRRLCFDIASALYLIYISDTGSSTDGKLDSLLNSLLLADRNSLYKFTKSFLLHLFGQEENNTHELITNAKKYIKNNLNKELTVTNISAMLYVNSSYFSRLFKKVTGEGCNEYVVRKRIERAKSLLESTDEKTGKIAGMVGYRDINYFSLAFKKNTGMSPTEYREKMNQVRT